MKFEDLPRGDWRKVKRDEKTVTQRRVVERVYVSLGNWSGSPAETVMAEIEGLLVDVEQASLSIEVDYGTGGCDESDRRYLELTGWKTATDDDVSKALTALKNKRDGFVRTKKMQEEKEVARLKRERPDLFK